MDTAVYTTKQVAESLNKTVNQIHGIKNKYKHLLNADHCILTRVDVNNILLWSGLGLNKLKELFSQEEEIMAARKWTESQKQRQRELIESWKPSQKSTGAKTIEGKAKVSQNSLKHGNFTAVKRLERNKIRAQIDKEILEIESQISDLKSQIMDLKNDRRLLSSMSDLETTDFKAKYPHNITCYEKKWIEARIAYESGEATKEQIADGLGVNIKTVQRRSIKELWRKNYQDGKTTELSIEPIQLTMSTDDDQTYDNIEESVFDRMKAFASENGIEIKTMQTA
jgi:hypothetical protein